MKAEYLSYYRANSETLRYQLIRFGLKAGLYLAIASRAIGVFLSHFD